MSQYKSILKATSIFGGTQVIQILILLIRTKFVALLIGGTGMGVQAIYVSSLAVFTTIFSMGLHASVVRDLSKANDAGDEVAFSRISKVFMRMLLVMSVLGAISVVMLSKTLSIISFGNNSHGIDFCFLSLYLVFTLLSQGNQAILTGKRRVKDLALSALIGSVVTLLTSVPFFYFWGLDGIVPGFVASTISNYLVTLYFRKRIKLVDVDIVWNDIKNYGRTVFVLGATLSITILVGNLTDYLVSIGISRMGEFKDLGYYNAGMSITGRVISLVFASLSADYFPRLAASFKSPQLMNETVNEECEVVLHLSTPILALFSLFSPFLITLLLSEEFQILNGFIRILCLGMFFKSFGYVLGTVSFAKGDKYVYLFFEAGYGNMANLIASLLLYHYYGLKGIAFGFVLCWTAYCVFVMMLDHFRYDYTTSASVRKVLSVNMVLMGLIMLCGMCLTLGLFQIVLYSVVVGITVIYNLWSLNKKTQMLSFLIRKR